MAKHPPGCLPGWYPGTDEPTRSQIPVLSILYGVQGFKTYSRNAGDSGGRLACPASQRESKDSVTLWNSEEIQAHEHTNLAFDR